MCGTQSGPIRFSPGKKPKNPWETPSGRHHGNVAAGRDLSFEGGKIRRANFVCPASLFLPSAGRADTPLRPPRWCIGSRSPTDRTMASEAVGPGSIPGGTTTSRRKRRDPSMEQGAGAAGGPRSARLHPLFARKVPWPARKHGQSLPTALKAGGFLLPPLRPAFLTFQPIRKNLYPCPSVLKPLPGRHLN